MRTQALRRFIVFTACCTFLLLIAGALVTSNDAGLSVPDWPLSYGSLLPPMVGGIRFEHGHRLIAAFVGLLTIILAVWIWQRESRSWVRWLGVAALGLVIAQGVLGGVTVLFSLPTAVSVAHATLAQLFFSTVVSLALFTGAWWQSDLPPCKESASPQIRSIGMATVAAIFLQLILGAAFRHKGVGIVPHLVGAGVVAGMVLWLVVAVRRRHGQVDALRGAARALEMLLGAQLLLGAAAYWVGWSSRNAPQPLLLEIIVTVTHVVVGALTLAASVWLTLCCFRVIRAVGGVPVASRPERAAT